MGLGRYQKCIWLLCGFGYFLDLLVAQALGLGEWSAQNCPDRRSANWLSSPFVVASPSKFAIYPEWMILKQRQAPTSLIIVAEPAVLRRADWQASFLHSLPGTKRDWRRPDYHLLGVLGRLDSRCSLLVSAPVSARLFDLSLSLKRLPTGDCLPTLLGASSHLTSRASSPPLSASSSPRRATSAPFVLSLLSVVSVLAVTSLLTPRESAWPM